MKYAITLIFVFVFSMNAQTIISRVSIDMGINIGGQAVFQSGGK